MNPRRPVVLASRSPRRKELLERFGIPFEAFAPDVDESRITGAPRDVARNLAGKKSWAICELLEQGGDIDTVVLAADTVVELDGEALGKPADAAHAQSMLQRLSGRAHHVHTGVATTRSVGGGHYLLTGDVETSEVRFKPLSKEAIEAYIASGDPFGKAGAYGIQSGGRDLVESFSGCYYNIVGLPVKRVFRLLELEEPACDCAAHALQAGRREGCRGSK